MKHVALWLLLLVPIAAAVHYLLDARPLWTFVAGVAAIVPLAEWIRRGTEQISHRAGAAIGGLLNATFGNTAELVLAIFVLLTGQADVVKAQITGSIIGNGLLGFGLAITIGTWGKQELGFKRDRASLLSSLLMLVVIALLVPALFDYTERGIFASTEVTSLDEKLSLCVAVVLILVYAANLVYTLVTDRDVFAPDEPPEQKGDVWPLRRSVAVLVGATIGTAWMAELVSGAARRDGDGDRRFDILPWRDRARHHRQCRRVRLLDLFRAPGTPRPRGRDHRRVDDPGGAARRANPRAGFARRRASDESRVRQSARAHRDRERCVRRERDHARRASDVVRGRVADRRLCAARVRVFLRDAAGSGVSEPARGARVTHERT